MANSKCPHCGRSSFEIKEVTPTGSAFKLHFIQCGSCGAPFGIIEATNIGDMLARQNKAIKSIAKAVNAHVEL